MNDLVQSFSTFPNLQSGKTVVGFLRTGIVSVSLYTVHITVYSYVTSLIIFMI